MLTVDLTHPLASVCLLDEASSPAGPEAEVVPDHSDTHAALQQQWAQHIDEQKRIFTEACRALEASAAALNDRRARLFTDHKDEIAKLAVEIARKVLMQQVLAGAYDMETIVSEALEHVPTKEGVVVYLHPDDLDRCRRAQETADSALAGVTLAADPSIGRAECRVESPKGVIQSLIDEHLDQIGKALLHINDTKGKE